MTQERRSAIARDTQDTTTEITATVKGKTADLISHAGAVVEDVKDKAAEVGAQVATKADHALNATGERLAGVAQTIRENAPTEGKVAEVATATAAALERGGEYLQLAELSDIRADAERLVRQYPLQSLLVSVGIGYLLARATQK